MSLSHQTSDVALTMRYAGRKQGSAPRVRALRLVDSPGAGAGAASGEPELLEREAELDALERAVSAVARGDGGAVIVEAPAGLGTTTLLVHAAGLARAAGCLVRAVSPPPRGEPFELGVLRELLEAAVRRRAVAECEPRRGPADAAAAILLGEAGGDSDAGFVHGLVRLCARLGARRGLVLILDGAERADRASLEALCHLARRTAELPVLVLLGVRAGTVASELTGLLGDGPSVTVLRPRPLSPAAGARLAARLAPDAELGPPRQWHLAAGGIPWLLELVARGSAAGRPVPDEAARAAVRRRLAELAPAERALLAAQSIAGDDAPVSAIAAMAGTLPGVVGAARDRAAAAGLLEAGGERFAHDVIAAAIRAELSPGQLARLHSAAARSLMHAGAPVEAIAEHLMRARPEGDRSASELLRRAAGGAASAGRPGRAAAYLERVLAEHALGEDRATVLLALARATFDAGRSDGIAYLREALEYARDARTRTEILTALAARGIVERQRVDVPPVGGVALETAALDALLRDPVRRAVRLAGLQRAPGADPLLRRVVLAHRAWLAAERGDADAGACAALALEALADGTLLRAAWERSAYHLCVGVLVMSDRVGEAARAIAALRGEAARRGSGPIRAACAWYAAELALRRGRLGEAEREAREAIALGSPRPTVVAAGARRVRVQVLAERGAIGEARALAAGITGAGARSVEASLLLAEGDYAGAYAAAREVGARWAARGLPNPPWAGWRTTAALALAHLGARDEAMALADAELAAARRVGAPVAIARALVARAVAEPDDAARIALCTSGVAAFAGGTARLEVIRLRLELGSALARTGARVHAREALRRALADADADGLAPLVARARRELVATGLRPRRAALEGPAALTPRQRQICELAAAGNGNRAIADQLFVSMKTVETHLAASFRKLGVAGRAELRAALAE